MIDETAPKNVVTVVVVHHIVGLLSCCCHAVGERPLVGGLWVNRVRLGLGRGTISSVVYSMWSKLL